MKLFFNRSQHGLKLFILVFEIADILCFLDKILVHFYEIIVDSHLLAKLSPEASDHQEAF